MISVEEMPRFPASIDEVIEEKAEANHVYEGAIRRAMGQAQAQGMRLTPHVVVGHPVSAIVDFVKNGKFDLLIVGFMGHTALYDRIIGSKTERLVEYAPCAVLVIK
jgi:nucleotide-binding universal stress UspA family protein